MQTTFQPALEFDFATLAQLFNRSFEGYFVAMNLSAASLAGICRVDSSDLSSGVVALHDNTPIGIMLIARRVHTSRIHGMGIFVYTLV